MNKFSPLAINFARRSPFGFIVNTPNWLIGVGVLGLSLCICAICFGVTLSNQDQQIDMSIEQARHRIDVNSHPAVKPTLIPETRILALNAVVGQLNLPWSDLFDALEQATPSNIALVSLEPDAKKHSIKGEAEALNSDDMIAYIEQLKKNQLFINVVLLKHDVSEQDPFKPIRFEFEAQWRDLS